MPTDSSPGAIIERRASLFFVRVGIARQRALTLTKCPSHNEFTWRTSFANCPSENGVLGLQTCAVGVREEASGYLCGDRQPLATHSPEIHEIKFFRGRSWALCVAMPLLLLVALAGCGGGGSKSTDEAYLDPNKPWGGLGSKEAYMEWKAEHEKKEAEREAVKPKPKAPAVAKSKKKAKAPAPAAVEKKPQSEPAKLPPLPSAPRDVALWSERDFIVARARGKPQFMAAIAHLAANAREEERAAIILAKVLQPKQFSQLQGLVDVAPAATKGQYSVKVATAIVDALAQNRTPAARRVLGQLIMGELATENNNLAATHAITALATHPSPSHEEMLLRVVTDAEQLASSTGAGPSAEDLRQQALASVNKNPPSSLRARIAEHLIDDTMSPAVRAALEKVISAPVAQNFDAHLTLYLAPREAIPFREAIERQFAGYSGDALLSLLTPNGAPADSAWNRRVADSLWTEKFSLMVEARLNRLDLWAEGPSLLSLACSLPTDAMRVAVARRLEKQWALGPNPVAAQQIGETVLEPGMLAVLRDLLHERTESAPRPKTPLASLRSGYGRRGYLGDRTLEEYQRVQSAWAELVGELASIWCGRCREAALHNDTVERARGNRVDWTAIVNEIPVQPHSADSVVAAHSVAWTQDGDRDPLQLHYVRLEERARPERLLSTYRRMWPEHHERLVTDGVCFEGVVEGLEQGFLRSVDVRVTRAAPGAQRRANEEQELVVEILVVEIRNPRRGE